MVIMKRERETPLFCKKSSKLFFLSLSLLYNTPSPSLHLPALLPPPPNTSYSLFLATLVVAASFLQKTSSKNEISPPPPKPLLRLEDRALHPLSLAAAVAAAAALVEAPPLPSSLAWPPAPPPPPLAVVLVRLFRLRHVSLMSELSPPGPQKKTPMCSSGCAALTWPCWIFIFLLK